MDKLKKEGERMEERQANGQTKERKNERKRGQRQTNSSSDKHCFNKNDAPIK
jgi:hypothetical protein